MSEMDDNFREACVSAQCQNSQPRRKLKNDKIKYICIGRPFKKLNKTG